MASKASTSIYVDFGPTQLSLRVERYVASVNASVNHDVYAPQYAWDFDETDPLYRFSVQLTIMATSFDPKERAGELYELTIHGDDARSQRVSATLKDAQARDRYGAPQYRQYRGKQIPVYNPPKGLGILNKIRGESRWTAWLFVPARFANDALALLAHQKTLFVALHERKEKREHWVQSTRALGSKHESANG
jgi:hypothetical protein